MCFLLSPLIVALHKSFLQFSLSSNLMPIVAFDIIIIKLSQRVTRHTADPNTPEDLSTAAADVTKRFVSMCHYNAA